MRPQIMHPATGKIPRRELVASFTLAGATAGFLAGLCEAARLYFWPRVPKFVQPDVNCLVWFLSPLIGEFLFGLAGLALALAAVRDKSLSPQRIAILVAAGLGLVTLYVHLAVNPFHSWVGESLTIVNWAESSACSLTVFVLGLVTYSAFLRSRRDWFGARVSRLDRLWPKVVVATTLVCISPLAWYSLRSWAPIISKSPTLPQTQRRPNVVLVVLDTVRADHLSAYGYHRLTTPNLDRLADQGVLFENAVAPSGWTLPSIVSIFTGLLPHQHGAGTTTALDPRIRTLAEILKSHGYETAGFNANPVYGLGSWGIGQGFEVYKDDSTTLKHNLAVTLVGRLLIQPLYQRLIRFNDFDRRYAPEINQQVFRWFRRRSSRPFFLFINYFDAHFPYLQPPHDERESPRISSALVNRGGGFEYRGDVPAPPRGEEDLLVAAYDHSLTDLDTQVCKLVDFLSHSPEWPNTILIITADHGESLSEHGMYGHRGTLYREVLHVPLIFVGPGIPTRRRVSHMSRIRELFSTILDLTLGERASLGNFSLCRFWAPGYRFSPSDELALSELTAISSLTTSEWQYVCDVSGREQLYHWAADPAEKTDLSEAPQYQPYLQSLRTLFEKRVSLSTKPWRGPGYLVAIGHPGWVTAASSPGTSQNPSNPSSSTSPTQLPPADKDLLRSLPY